MHVSDLVRRAIRSRFNEVDAPVVERLLDIADLGDGAGARGHDRIQLAMLMQAHGDLELLARSLALAATDWRDLLVGAGLANDDWPQVLRAAGFPVP